MTGFDVRRKRPGWLGWIPTTILVLALVAVGVTASVLIGSGVGTPAPRPTEGQVTGLNWSTFTDEGLAYIRDSRQVRIDLSNAPVRASDLGLDPDARLELEPIDNLDVVLDYALIYKGGGAAPGGEKLRVSGITLVTEGGELTHVIAPLTETYNFRQSLDLLVAQSETYGWDAPDVPGILDRVAEASRAGQGYSFTFGPGDRLGVPVTATATCDVGSFCTVEYDLTPRVR